MLEAIISGIGIGLGIAMPVGPGTIEIVRRGLKSGFFSAFLVGLGCLSADLIYIALVYFGLIGFVSIGWIKAVMLMFGCGFLLYLGISGLFKVRKIETKDTKEKSTTMILTILLFVLDTFLYLSCYVEDILVVYYSKDM